MVSFHFIFNIAEKEKVQNTEAVKCLFITLFFHYPPMIEVDFLLLMGTVSAWKFGRKNEDENSQQYFVLRL